MKMLKDLICVVVCARHGDRTPSLILPEHLEAWHETLPEKHVLLKYPIEPRLEDESKQNVASRLTRKGLDEMLQLGQQLKSRYAQFLEDDRASFYSTDYERTARSAVAVASVLSSSVTVKSTNRKRDPLDPWESTVELPSLVERFREENSAYIGKHKEWSMYYPAVRKGFNGYFPSSSNFAWIIAFDLLICSESHPEIKFLSDDVLIVGDTIKAVTLEEFSLLYADHKIRQFAIGGLLGGILSWFKDVSTSSKKSTKFDANLVEFDRDSRFAFVSCHDVNILPLKAALNWDDENPSWPEYGYYLAFELYPSGVHTYDSHGKTRRKMSWEEFETLCENHSL